MKKLPLSFYQRDDVVQVAKEMLGKLLVTRKNGVTTSGRIVEVEAYAGATDRASHAFGGKITNRNRIMYEDGGFAYVYLCYGIHHLFNVVTHRKDVPHAILVRAVEPIRGMATMLERTGREKPDHIITRGPGNLSKALGITVMDSGKSLLGSELYLAEDKFAYQKNEVTESPRIGVDYAGTHALWPYRFFIKGNPFVSGRPR